MLKSRDRLSTKAQKLNDEKIEQERGIAKLEKAFGDDEPILGFDEINETLDDAEDRHTSLIVATIWNSVDMWLKRISKPLDDLDDDAIAKIPLNLTTPVQGLLMNAWREIFVTGSRDGIAEINELNIANKEKSPKGLFGYDATRLVSFIDGSRRGKRSRKASVSNSITNFRNSFSSNSNFASRRDLEGVDRFIKRKPVFEVAYPPDNADLDLIEVDELRDALSLRTQVLAEDLSQEVSDRIDRVIKDSVDLHNTDGKKIKRLTKASRTKIVNKINGIIGKERQVQRAAGVPESELARTKIPVPGDSGFLVKRARMIASTELNSGYNMGRLQAYSRSNVKYVRWQTIDDNRTCSYCRSRTGTVMPLNTVLTSGLRYSRAKKRSSKYGKFQYFLPAHPMCRCAWQAATDKEIKDKRRGAGFITAPVPLPGSWPRISAAAGLMSKIGTAGTALSVVDRIVREKQLQEKSKRRARNRVKIAAGGALSLGVLSIAMWSWLNRPKTDEANKLASSKLSTIQKGLAAVAGEEAIEKSVKGKLVKTQGQILLAKSKREATLRKARMTPRAVMRGTDISHPSWSAKRKEDYEKFLDSDIDIRSITDQELVTKYSLHLKDIAAIRNAQKKYGNNIVKTSAYDKILPASVFSAANIAKHPWLGEIEDVRSLTLNKMIEKGKSTNMSKTEVVNNYDKVYRKIRRSAGLSRVSKEERDALRKINSVENRKELADILNLAKNEQSTVNNLFNRIQNLKQKGRKLESLSQLRVTRNIGAKTVANILEAEGGDLRINEVIASSDKSFAIARLHTIPGVSNTIAKKIYDVLKESGQQFENADEMVERLKEKGVNVNSRLKSSIEKRLEFHYLPGLDRQPVGSVSSTFPGIPSGERRSDNQTDEPGNT